MIDMMSQMYCEQCAKATHSLFRWMEKMLCHECYLANVSSTQLLLTQPA
jgi:hypothetical protein